MSRSSRQSAQRAAFVGRVGRTCEQRVAAVPFVLGLEVGDGDDVLAVDDALVAEDSAHRYAAQTGASPRPLRELHR